MDQFGIDDSGVGLRPARGMGPPAAGGAVWWLKQVRGNLSGSSNFLADLVARSQILALPLTLISWPLGLILGGIGAQPPYRSRAQR